MSSFALIQITSLQQHSSINASLDLLDCFVIHKIVIKIVYLLCFILCFYFVLLYLAIITMCLFIIVVGIPNRIKKSMSYRIFCFQQVKAQGWHCCLINICLCSYFVNTIDFIFDLEIIQFFLIFTDFIYMSGLINSKAKIQF